MSPHTAAKTEEVTRILDQTEPLPPPYLIYRRVHRTVSNSMKTGISYTCVYTAVGTGR